MKKLLFVFIALVFSAGMLVAQVQMFFGAEVGPQLSKFRFSGFQNEYTKKYYEGNDYKSNGTGNIQAGLRVGAKFGEKFSLYTDPSFFLKKFNYETSSVTRETTRKINDLGKPEYAFNQEGNRSWTFNTRALHVPIIARYNLLGDRIGLHLTGGLSINYFISGDYTTEFQTIDRNNVIKVNNNPIIGVESTDNPPVFYGYATYSEEFPDNGDKLRFGKADTDHFNNLDVSLLLGAGTFFNLNDDGTLRLTLDFRFDLGQTNMYTKARTDYLENISGITKISDLDNSNTKYNLSRQSVLVSGKQKMISSVFSIGVEFCPSCGF